jgi:hypothetical protein
MEPASVFAAPQDLGPPIANGTVKGLKNAAGENNCFLNAALQVNFG